VLWFWVERSKVKVNGYGYQQYAGVGSKSVSGLLVVLECDVSQSWV